MRRKQANPKPVKVEGDEMPGTSDSARSPEKLSSTHGLSSNRESSDVDEYDERLVIDTGTVPSTLSESTLPSEPVGSPATYSIIELSRSVEMVYYSDTNAEDVESRAVSSIDSCDKEISLSGSVTNSEISNNFSSVSLADISVQETDQASAAKSKHSLSKSRKKSDRILPKAGVNGEQKYFCPLCDEAFPAEHDFTRHIRSHNSPTNVSNVNMCTICHKVLSSQSSLDRHMLVHSGERPFKCDSCGQAFTTNGNMHRHMRTHDKNAQANAGLPNEQVLKPRKKKKQLLQPDVQDATSSQQHQQQTDPTNLVVRLPVNKKRKITDLSDDFEVPKKKKRTLDNDFAKYLLSFVNSQDSAKKSAVSTQSSVLIDPTSYPLKCSECHTTFFSRFHLLADLEEHERSQKEGLSVTCVTCEVKLNCVSDFGDHVLSAHCSSKGEAVVDGLENSKPAFNDLMAVVPFSSERFSQLYKIVMEKPSKHQVQRNAVNYCFGCEHHGCQTKKLDPNCSGSFCDCCRLSFCKCEKQRDRVLLHEREVILSGYTNQTMNHGEVIQDRMAKTEFLQMLDLKRLSESKVKHLKNSLQFDANQNVIKIQSSGDKKPQMTLKSLPLRNVLQNSILPKLSLTEGTVSHRGSAAVGEEMLVAKRASLLNLRTISAKHIVALIENPKVLTVPGAIKIDQPRMMDGSPGIDEARILPRLEEPINSIVKLEDDRRESSTETQDQPLSSTPSSLQFRCSQCSYSSTDRSTLDRHMRTHNGERPFRCLYCDYCFTTKANCERHIKTKHTTENKESGTDCIRLPAEASTSARSHSSSHSHPYQCKACPKHFASRANLLRHTQRQHVGLVSESVGDVKSGESLVSSGLTLLASEAENCSRQLSSESGDHDPLQLTSLSNLFEARQQSRNSGACRGFAAEAEDSDEPLDFSLKSQRTSAQNDSTGHPWESNEPIDLTIRGQGQQHHLPREGENSRSGHQLTVPSIMLTLPAPVKGTAADKSWIKKPLLPPVNATNGLFSDLHAVNGHFCCAICQLVFKHKVELSVHMRSHRIEKDLQLCGEASSSSVNVKPDLQAKTVHPQFTAVASSAFFSSSSSLNKQLDFEKSPIPVKEPNNNVAGSVNANFVKKPKETKKISMLEGDLASVNRILESTSGKQLQPLLDVTDSTTSPSESPSTSFHGRPDLAISMMNIDHSFADAIAKSIAQNIILKSEGVSGKRKTEAADDDDGQPGEQGTESGTMKKKRNSYADSPRKLQCEFCTRAFPWISSLKRHILTHTGQKPYRCKQCGTTFSTKSNRERHMIRKHGLDVHDPTTRQTMDRPYKCHLCVFSSFTTSGKLMRHYKVKHPDKEVPETLLTSACSLSHDDSDLMPRSGSELLTADEKAEMQNSEDENDDPTDDEVNELTYQMMAKSRLMQTMNHSEAALSCSLVTPVNGSVSHLFTASAKDNSDGLSEKHINPERDNYNVDKITDCWKCKRTFNDRKTLLRHLKEHNIDLPFKCYLCDASFEDRLMSLEHKHDEHPSDWATVQEKNKVSNLKEYSEFMEAVVKDTLDGKVTRRTHEGVELDIKPEPDYAQRKVFCTLCPKRFWSLQDLRRHMRSHTGDRPFECDICLSRFTLKHSMVRHRRKHMTEGVSASAEAQCSASDEDSMHASTVPPGDGLVQSPPKMSDDSPGDSARVSLSLGQVLPEVAASTSSSLLLAKSSSSSSMKILVSPSKATSSADQSDLLQTLLDIDDKSTIDRMLESPTDAASMLGIRRPKTEQTICSAQL